jgi:putative FmdB family regulatory protein
MYEFQCGGCEHTFEELVLSAAETVACPKCGSERVEKLLSRFAFKSGSVFRSASAKGAACSGCHPGPSGCGSCGH